MQHRAARLQSCRAAELQVRRGGRKQGKVVSGNPIMRLLRPIEIYVSLWSLQVIMLRLPVD